MCVVTEEHVKVPTTVRSSLGIALGTSASGADYTYIVKVFLNIRKEEQLERFKTRLDDSERY